MIEKIWNPDRKKNRIMRIFKSIFWSLANRTEEEIDLQLTDGRLSNARIRNQLDPLYKTVLKGKIRNKLYLKFWWTESNNWYFASWNQKRKADWWGCSKTSWQSTVNKRFDHFHLITYSDHSPFHLHLPCLVILILNHILNLLSSSYQFCLQKLEVSLDKMLIWNTYCIIWSWTLMVLLLLDILQESQHGVATKQLMSEIVCQTQDLCS